MEDKTEELVSFIQERCLWQFHSRSWDREENINGIMRIATEILTNKQIDLESPAEKCFYADAKLLVDEATEKLPWLLELENAQLEEVTERTKERLIEITVTKSKNNELKNPHY